MKFFIKTNIPSQKNSKMIAFNKSTNRPFIMSNPKVKEWQVETAKSLIGLPNIFGPVEISMKFVHKDRRKKDIDNEQTSILDLLKNNGIIEDDNCFIVRKLNAEFVGIDKDNYGVEIEIKKINIDN